MQSIVSDELLKKLNGMLGQMIGEVRGYSLDDEIRRRVDSGAAEEARLTKLALESGAQPGEFIIQWRWRRGVGAWPYLR